MKRDPTNSANKYLQTKASKYQLNVIQPISLTQQKELKYFQ